MLLGLYHQHTSYIFLYVLAENRPVFRYPPVCVRVFVSMLMLLCSSPPGRWQTFSKCVCFCSVGHLIIMLLGLYHQHITYVLYVLTENHPVCVCPCICMCACVSMLILLCSSLSGKWQTCAKFVWCCSVGPLIIVLLPLYH